MEDKYNVPCFSSRGIFLVLREAITSFRWIGKVIVVWFLLQNSSNCQTTSEPAPILTLRADPRKFDPFTPKIAYSPTGRFIASWNHVIDGGSSITKELKIWDAATGREVLSLAEPCHLMAYSPNEDVVLIASYQGTTVHSLTDGQKIARLEDRGLDRVWFTHDGKTCLTMDVSSKQLVRSDGNLEDVDEPKMVTLKALSSRTWKETPIPLNEKGQLYVWATVSKNAKLVASFVKKDDGDFTIKIWDLSTGETLPSPDVFYSLLFMPEFTSNDQLLLVPDSNNTVEEASRLWSVKHGHWLTQRAYIYPCSGFPAILWPYSASPELTIEATDELFIVRDSGTDRIKTQFPRPKSWNIDLLAFFNGFPHGKGSHLLSERTLVVAYPKATTNGQTSSLDFVDLLEGRVTSTLENHQFFAGSRTGKYFATRDSLTKNTVVWRESEVKKIAELPMSFSLQFSPNEETFATANKGVVNIWRIPDHSLPPLTPP